MDLKAKEYQSIAPPLQSKPIRLPAFRTHLSTHLLAPTAAVPNAKRDKEKLMNNNELQNLIDKQNDSLVKQNKQLLQQIKILKS